ncbi:nucleic acid-binding, OB-fold protein [Tanacetum coccineum]
MAKVTSGSSSMNDDELARLMVTEMTTQEEEQREAFLEIKRKKMECRELDIVIDIKYSQTLTQVIGDRVEKKEFYKIILSDGSVCKDVIIYDKIAEMIRSKQLQKGSIVQLTRFSSNTGSPGLYGLRKVLSLPFN